MKNRVRTRDALAALADERIPFPHTEQPTPCRADPALFSFEEIPDRLQREKTIARAKRACSGCSVVQGCLKWTLANPSMTRKGVWAATTPGQRGVLRNRLVQRLGDDWVGAVADQDHRREQQQAAPTVPPPVRNQILARLELELIPTRPQPYEPWREPLTPQRRAHNRRVLEHALADKSPQEQPPSAPEPPQRPVTAGLPPSPRRP
ncbi:WhiB family transcriptional regulator [Streptomyces tauricus]|uniref:WhiB family transcriptional regulator n=1 Tax=Streptomyces tauricus TaxID=68274 RepID=UPI0022439548|nr:WhiB family transcriptional regulator [Streptomyces tauricus]MCW8101643.1 WhiB family transcriptional regulator [Streptomyces tauricus]